MYWTSSIVITFILIIIFRYYFQRRRLYELANKIPGHNGLPIFGEVFRFMTFRRKDFFIKTIEMMDENSTMTKFWLGPTFFLLTEDPDTVYTILNSPHCLSKPKIIYNSLGVSQSLLSLSGDTFVKHRRILNKAFVPSMLNDIYPIINEASKGLMSKLEEVLGKEVNIMHFIGACGLDSFTKAHFGYSKNFYDSMDMKFIERSLQLAMERLSKLWFHFLPKFVFNMTKLGKESEGVFAFGSEMRDKAVKLYNEGLTTEQKCIKNRVFDLLLDPNNNFSDLEIRDEFVIFMFASFDTSAKTASIALLLLALHPEIQKKLIAEIDDICSQDENFTMSIEFLKKFEYMDLVIKESMRLFPAGPTLARTTDAEIEAGGYTIPKGSTITVPVSKMHRNPKYWGSDAHLFNPERFLSYSVNPRAFTPFSGGKRICIGYRYADMFIKTVLVNFFRKYRVESLLKFEELTFTSEVTLNIDQGYKVIVKKRF